MNVSYLTLLSIGLQLDLESENLQDFAVLLPISESPFPAALDSGMCSLCYFYQKQVSFKSMQEFMVDFFLEFKLIRNFCPILMKLGETNDLMR